MTKTPMRAHSVTTPPAAAATQLEALDPERTDVEADPPDTVVIDVREWRPGTATSPSSPVASPRATTHDFPRAGAAAVMTPEGCEARSNPRPAV